MPTMHNLCNRGRALEKTYSSWTENKITIARYRNPESDTHVMSLSEICCNLELINLRKENPQMYTMEDQVSELARALYEESFLPTMKACNNLWLAQFRIVNESQVKALTRMVSSLLLPSPLFLSLPLPSSSPLSFSFLLSYLLLSSLTCPLLDASMLGGSYWQILDITVERCPLRARSMPLWLPSSPSAAPLHQVPR